MQYMIMGIFALTPPYYYNPNIHNFGNVGFGGRIHAELAPFATKMIDTMCYNDCLHFWISRVTSYPKF